MTTLAICGGTVCTDGKLIEADVLIDGLRITAVAPRERQRPSHFIDASGCSVLPGFVDVQLNGAMGVDLTTQPERIGEVAAFVVQCGVTSFMPTVISSSPGDTTAAIAVLREWCHETKPAARSLGVHLEGPFLNPQRAGAHPAHRLRPPSLAEAEGWTRDSGVGMVSLAPELPQAIEVIKRLVANNVAVCAGHTTATPSELDAAVAAGVRGVTHLFNAMGPINARIPGPAGAALADSELIAGLIVDGIHVDPGMVRLALRAMGPNRIALVSDAISALGLRHGTYSIGDTHVTVDDSGVHTPDGVLAGSVLRFDEAVRNLMAFTGCGLAEASISASTTPAQLAGRRDIGRLTPGYAADVVVLDENNNVAVTMVDGRVVFDPQHRRTGL
ncbi:MAG: N-acetylglucosamine-6-phosphate deacetylase [Ilumatobacteraceae bacterium]